MFSQGIQFENNNNKNEYLSFLNKIRRLQFRRHCVGNCEWPEDDKFHAQGALSAKPFAICVETMEGRSNNRISRSHLGGVCNSSQALSLHKCRSAQSARRRSRAADRPNMSPVVPLLSSESPNLPEPKPPAYFLRTSIRDSDSQLGNK
ncbi:hypothetical protein EJ110_NYTH20806 [Nymphaea thermarum]|nr:hypothetical protein EJ110_NYTH20806 [Nymphaea thermarum]